MHPELKLKVAGRAWHREGRYGSLIGRHPESESLVGAFCRDAEENEVIKLVNSGLNSLKVFGRQTPAQFSPEEIAALVSAAAGKSRKVMVHANGEEAVKGCS